MNAKRQELVTDFNAFTGTTLNLFLVFLINSDKTISSIGYRRLLTIISLYNVYYAIAHSVIDLGILIDEYGYLLFSKRWSRYGFWPSYFAVMVYVNSFTQSITLLAIHCLYRYVKITRNYEKLFSKSYGIAFIVIVHHLFGIVYTWLCCEAMKGSETRTKLSDEELRRRFNTSSEGLGYIGPVYAVQTDAGLVINWVNIGAGMGCSLILLILYGTVCVTGIKLLNFLKTAIMSESARKLQYRLLTVLLAQAIAPLIFEYVPVASCCWGGFIGLPLSDAAMYAPVAISAYPLADALLVIMLLKTYRRQTLFVLLNCITCGHPGLIYRLIDKYHKTSSAISAGETSFTVASKYGAKGNQPTISQS